MLSTLTTINTDSIVRYTKNHVKRKSSEISAGGGDIYLRRVICVKRIPATARAGQSIFRMSYNEFINGNHLAHLTPAVKLSVLLNTVRLHTDKDFKLSVLAQLLRSDDKGFFQILKTDSSIKTAIIGLIRNLHPWMLTRLLEGMEKADGVKLCLGIVEEALVDDNILAEAVEFLGKNVPPNKELAVAIIVAFSRFSRHMSGAVAEGLIALIPEQDKE